MASHRRDGRGIYEKKREKVQEDDELGDPRVEWRE